MSSILCGRSRPNHFTGVLTVVLKLFNLVRPYAAVFGKKDYQQLTMIQKMVSDLHVDVEIVACDTVREASGLARSSRNQYLSAEGKEQAATIYAALQAVHQTYLQGQRDKQQLLNAFYHQIALQKDIKVEYAELLGQKDLKAFEQQIDAPAVLLVAAHLHGVRLIDNLELG
jgi:pantoate ligase/cytidylate kinase